MIELACDTYQSIHKILSDNAEQLYDVSEHLANYINYNGIAHDLNCNGYWIKDNHQVFIE